MHNDLMLLDCYEKNPVLRGLIQLVPFGIGSGIDIALCVTLENIKHERMKIFFEELGSGSIELSPKLLESEDFLHCYFATAKAAFNSRRKEKIEMFARLLKSATKDGNFFDTDEFEEYLSILDELSYREIMILLKLYNYESEHPVSETENGMQRAYLFWKSFIEDVEISGVPSKEIEAVLTRLTKTGCYEIFVGKYWDHTGGKGMTTPTFKRLKQLIESKKS